MTAKPHTEAGATRDPGRPSRTSIMVAAARAFGAHDPDPGVRNPDWLAEHLLGPNELELIKEHPVSAALAQDYREAGRDLQVVGLAFMMIIRTRFIDAHLKQAVQQGARQVVILGAGFDSRAYRLHELLRDVAVFEVDSPATQQTKKRRVETVLGGAPRNVTYVPLDFNSEKVGEVLPGAGWHPAERTAFLWEGVSMYIAEEGVRETLRTIATQSAPGSTLVMDFASRNTVEMIRLNPDMPMMKQLTAWGEPWIFGVPDGREKEFFLDLGFEPPQVFPMYNPEFVMRYVTRRDGTLFGVTPGMPRLMPQAPASAAGSPHGPSVAAANFPAAAPGAIPAPRPGAFYSLAELVVR